MDLSLLPERKNIMNKPEILAPAGSLAKLKYAIMYGADAVYIGGEAFSLRVAAKNFTLDEIKEGIEFAHERGKKVYITANKNSIPNDPEKPFVTSGIRVGTPAVTARGFKEAEMEIVGKLICEVAKDDFESKIDSLRAQVKELTGKYPLYQG